MADRTHGTTDPTVSLLYEPGRIWTFRPPCPADRPGFFIRPADPGDPDQRDRVWLSLGLVRAEARWARRLLTRKQRLASIPHIRREMLRRMEGQHDDD